MKCLNSKTAEQNVETLKSAQDSIVEMIKEKCPPNIAETFLAKPPLKITTKG
jgi:hypothetical protein